jgi:hypothetical protein
MAKDGAIVGLVREFPPQPIDPETPSDCFTNRLVVPPAEPRADFREAVAPEVSTAAVTLAR